MAAAGPRWRLLRLLRIAARLRVRRLAALACLCFAPASFAHVDRALNLQPDGSLPEIPARFGRATVDISWPDGDPIQVKLTIGKNAYRLPACAARLIRTRELRDVQFSASWYPPGQRSNYYISMVFYDPGTEHRQMGGEFVWLIFDLFTAELKTVWLQRHWFLGWGLSVDREAMTRYCRPEELKTAALRAGSSRTVD